MSYLSPQSLDELRAIRQDIHAHPEIAFEEKRTAQIVADYLHQCGVDEVHENFGGYGVVGIINGKKPGKSIGLRADMDALPMQEVVPDGQKRPYCSVTPGRFHGCGHDGHTVMLLGAAQYLASHRDFAGRVVLIFQPGEENLSGAAEMLKAGLLEHFPFEEIYGLHNYGNGPLGEITINEGAALSGSDNFTINIRGKGSHGATPQFSIDPIVISASLIMNFQTIISRNVPPLQAAALSFGEIQGGSSHNIIPDTLRLRGTLRTYQDDVRCLVKERMQAIVDAASSGFSCQAQLSYTQNCPPLINDTPLALALAQTIPNFLCGEKVNLSQTPNTPSEDFSLYLQHVKGVYAFMNTGLQWVHHHPHYDFNDELIAHGVAFWVAVVHARLPLTLTT